METKTNFGFLSWVKALGIAVIISLVMTITTIIPEFLNGWLSCLAFMYSYSRFTNTKLLYVPKDKITDDMEF